MVTSKEKLTGHPGHENRDVRADLIEAALTILLQDGILGFSQSKVAKHAGLRQSHLTYYFPTRNDLLKVVVEHGCQVVIDSLAPQSVPGGMTLNEFRLGLCDRVCNSNIARLKIAITVAAEEDPSLKPWILNLDRRMCENGKDVLRQLGVCVAEQDMALFHTTVIGVAVRGLNSSTEADVTALRQEFFYAFDRLLNDANQYKRAKHA